MSFLIYLIWANNHHISPCCSIAKLSGPVVRNDNPPPPKVTFEKEVNTAILSRAQFAGPNNGIGVCFKVLAKS